MEYSIDVRNEIFDILFIYPGMEVESIETFGDDITELIDNCHVFTSDNVTVRIDELTRNDANKCIDILMDTVGHKPLVPQYAVLETTSLKLRF